MSDDRVKVYGPNPKQEPGETFDAMQRLEIVKAAHYMMQHPAHAWATILSGAEAHTPGTRAAVESFLRFSPDIRRDI